jgi:hypothetical protein
MEAHGILYEVWIFIYKIGNVNNVINSENIAMEMQQWAPFALLTTYRCEQCVYGDFRSPATIKCTWAFMKIVQYFC